MRLAIVASTALALAAPTASAAGKRPMTIDDLLAVKGVADPRLSPDGTRVVYVVSEIDAKKDRTNSDLWMVPLEGGEPKRLSTSPGADHHPRWSPDGLRIAFVSDRGGSSQVWLLPVDGGEARPLTTLPIDVAGPIWSPRGDAVAFSAEVYPGKTPGETAAKDKAKAFVAGNAPKMARLTLLAPPRTRIEIDDRPRGLAPLARPVVVFAGKVHLRAIADGGRTVDEQLVTAPGETRTLDLQAKLAAPAPSSSASAAGAAGGASSAASSASPEPPLPHRVDADDDGAPARTLGWTLTLGGAALAVVGGGTILLAGASLSSRRDALTADCFAASGTDACVTANPGRTSAAQDDVDSIATWKGVRIGGIVALGTGVSIAAVGLVRLLTAPSPTLTGRWTPTLDLAAHGGTFGLRGAF
ncbi:MAG: hypothetical protein NVS3B10_27670 [Polyangiales bacterium]